MTKEIEKVLCKQILSVNRKGIRLINNKNKEVFVDFEICNKNWIEYVKTSEDFCNKNDYLSAQSKCVGWRNCVNNPMFFEFFNCEIVRIEFKKPLFNFLSSEEFIAFERKLNKYGWVTYDLT